jgi:hypothetical protein
MVLLIGISCNTVQSVLTAALKAMCSNVQSDAIIKLCTEGMDFYP